MRSRQSPIPRRRLPRGSTQSRRRTPPRTGRSIRLRRTRQQRTQLRPRRQRARSPTLRGTEQLRTGGRVGRTRRIHRRSHLTRPWAQSGRRRCAAFDRAMQLL